MERPRHNIVIAGDVDHGKSTLIGRLLFDTGSLPHSRLAEITAVCQKLGKSTELAYLVDQLKEERQKEMTIDSAQMFLKTKKADYALIDAPGHTQLIKNMLTGAAQADAAILVIDITRDIKAQTRRHAYLLDMLGIKNIIVAANKIDLLHHERSAYLHKEALITQALKDLNFATTPIIPLSAQNGANVALKRTRTAWYQGKTLLEAIEALSSPKHQTRQPFRFPVQDVYTINRQKILVGQITSGAIENGQMITLLPQGTTTRLKAIKIFGRSLRKASQGESIGLIIKTAGPIQRGCIISATDKRPLTTKTCRGELFWLAKADLRLGAEITITCATQTIRAKVTRISNKKDPATMDAATHLARSQSRHELATVSFTTRTPIVMETTGAQTCLGRFTVTQGARLHGVGVFC